MLPANVRRVWQSGQSHAAKPTGSIAAAPNQVSDWESEIDRELRELGLDAGTDSQKNLQCGGANDDEGGAGGLAAAAGQPGMGPMLSAREHESAYGRVKTGKTLFFTNIGTKTYKEIMESIRKIWADNAIVQKGAFKTSKDDSVVILNETSSKAFELLLGFTSELITQIDGLISSKTFIKINEEIEKINEIENFLTANFAPFSPYNLRVPGIIQSNFELRQRISVAVAAAKQEADNLYEKMRSQKALLDTSITTKKVDDAVQILSLITQIHTDVRKSYYDETYESIRKSQEIFKTSFPAAMVLFKEHLDTLIQVTETALLSGNVDDLNDKLDKLMIEKNKIFPLYNPTGASVTGLQKQIDVLVQKVNEKRTAAAAAPSPPPPPPPAVVSNEDQQILNEVDSIIAANAPDIYKKLEGLSGITSDLATTIGEFRNKVGELKTADNEADSNIDAVKTALDPGFPSADTFRAYETTQAWHEDIFRTIDIELEDRIEKTKTMLETTTSFDDTKPSVAWVVGKLKEEFEAIPIKEMRENVAKSQSIRDELKSKFVDVTTMRDALDKFQKCVDEFDVIKQNHVANIDTPVAEKNAALNSEGGKVALKTKQTEEEEKFKKIEEQKNNLKDLVREALADHKHLVDSLNANEKLDKTKKLSDESENKYTFFKKTCEDWKEELEKELSRLEGLATDMVDEEARNFIGFAKNSIVNYEDHAKDNDKRDIFDQGCKAALDSVSKTHLEKIKEILQDDFGEDSEILSIFFLVVDNIKMETLKSVSGKSLPAEIEIRFSENVTKITQYAKKIEDDYLTDDIQTNIEDLRIAMVAITTLYQKKEFTRGQIAKGIYTLLNQYIDRLQWYLDLEQTIASIDDTYEAKKIYDGITVYEHNILKFMSELTKDVTTIASSENPSENVSELKNSIKDANEASWTDDQKREYGDLEKKIEEYIKAAATGDLGPSISEKDKQEINSARSDSAQAEQDANSALSDVDVGKAKTAMEKAEKAYNTVKDILPDQNAEVVIQTKNTWERAKTLYEETVQAKIKSIVEKGKLAATNAKTFLDSGVVDKAEEEAKKAEEAFEDIKSFKDNDNDAFEKVENFMKEAKKSAEDAKENARAAGEAKAAAEQAKRDAEAAIAHTISQAKTDAERNAMDAAAKDADDLLKESRDKDPITGVTSATDVSELLGSITRRDEIFTKFKSLAVDIAKREGVKIGECEELKIKKGEAEKNLGTIQTKNSSLESDIQSLKSENAALKADKASLESKLSAETGAKKNLETRVSALQGEKSALQAKISNMETQHKEEVKQLKQAKSKLESEFKKENDARKKTDGELSKLRNDIVKQIKEAKQKAVDEYKKTNPVGAPVASAGPTVVIPPEFTSLTGELKLFFEKITSGKTESDFVLVEKDADDMLGLIYKLKTAGDAFLPPDVKPRFECMHDIVDWICHSTKNLQSKASLSGISSVGGMSPAPNAAYIKLLQEWGQQMQRIAVDQYNASRKVSEFYGGFYELNAPLAEQKLANMPSM
jgi:hypothetical protein